MTVVDSAKNEKNQNRVVDVVTADIKEILIRFVLLLPDNLIQRRMT